MLKVSNYYSSAVPTPSRHREIVPFFKVIEGDSHITGVIQDYSISQTTLEEVFLNVSNTVTCQLCTSNWACIR